jgi:type I restriction enzyme R subunit
VSLARRARTVFKALLPDPSAQAITHRVAVIRSLAAKLESASEVPDISGVMDSVSQLLDRSVSAEEYVIRAGGDAGPLVDLNQLDFEQLALRFAGTKRTAAKQIEQNLEKRLDAAVRKNPTRIDLAERFRRLIDEYNAGTHNLEEFLRRLKAINDELTEDEQRTVREDLTEAELAIYDLLTKPEPELTKPEQTKVKAAAKHLLEHVTEKLVLDWRKRQHTRAAVQVAVGKLLDEELPEVYGPDLFDDKVTRVYEHIYASYFDNGESVYSSAVEVGSAAVPVATMPSTTAEVDDKLLVQIRNDPALFTKMMEEVFGLHETWTMPTDQLLTEETRHVEFKQSARWSLTSDDPKIHKTLSEEIIAKTVAGFLNGHGGTLLLGVNNRGQPLGLDADYTHVKPQNADGFVNWLDTMLQNTLGHTGAHRVQIRIDVINGIEVCRLDVPASSRPIWTRFKKQGPVLFVRRNNSTRQVPADEIDQFLAERFG